MNKEQRIAHWIKKYEEAGKRYVDSFGGSKEEEEALNGMDIAYEKINDLDPFAHI